MAIPYAPAGAVPTSFDNLAAEAGGIEATNPLNRSYRARWMPGF